MGSEPRVSFQPHPHIFHTCTIWGKFAASRAYEDAAPSLIQEGAGPEAEEASTLTLPKVKRCGIRTERKVERKKR